MDDVPEELWPVSFHVRRRASLRSANAPLRVPIQIVIGGHSAEWHAPIISSSA